MCIASVHDNCQDLLASGLPLAVSCRRCPHRVLLHARQIGVYEGDFRAIRRLPLVCRCGSKEVERIVLETPDEEEAFLAGSLPPTQAEADAAAYRPRF
jgi:hypothetical protein